MTPSSSSPDPLCVKGQFIAGKGCFASEPLTPVDPRGKQGTLGLLGLASTPLASDAPPSVLVERLEVAVTLARRYPVGSTEAVRWYREALAAWQRAHLGPRRECDETELVAEAAYYLDQLEIERAFPEEHRTNCAMYTAFEFFGNDDPHLGSTMHGVAWNMGMAVAGADKRSKAEVAGPYASFRWRTMVVLRSALAFTHLRAQFVICSSQITDYLFPMEQPAFDNLMSRGKQTEAAEVLETARARFRDDQRIYVMRGATANCHDLGRALSTAHAVGIIGPELTEAEGTMGDLRRELGDDAIHACLRATKDPMDPKGSRTLDALIDVLAPPRATPTNAPP